MPTETTKKKARKAARDGKKPTTQAGEFIREEMHKMKRGSGNIRSRKQAIAVGLSEARRAGVKLGSPSRSKPNVKKKAASDSAIGSGRKKSFGEPFGGSEESRTDAGAPLWPRRLTPSSSNRRKL